MGRISRMRKRRHLQLLSGFKVTCARCPIYNQIRSTYLGVEIRLQSDTANLDLWSYMKWIFDWNPTTPENWTHVTAVSDSDYWLQLYYLEPLVLWCTQWGWSRSWLTLGEGQGTIGSDRLSITGPTETNNHSHSNPVGLESPITSAAWTVGGIWSNQRKTVKTGGIWGQVLTLKLLDVPTTVHSFSNPIALTVLTAGQCPFWACFNGIGCLVCWNAGCSFPSETVKSDLQ